jgi:hypothetical protein
MSPIVEILVNGGVPEEYIVLLLGLPIIAVIIGIARYYIGIKTFSLHTPLILTTAFFYISSTYPGDKTTKILAGAILGIVFTVLVISSVITTQILTKKIRLHYFPKMSLLFSVSLITVFSALVIFQYLNLYDVRNINIFSIVLIAIIFERFVATYNKKKLKITLQLTLESIALSLVCYLVLVAEPVQALLLNHPGLVLLTLPINYIIGRFAGLRLREFLRFQDIINKEEKPENEPK